MPNRIRITEVQQSYRDVPGTVADTVDSLQLRGWVVVRQGTGQAVLTHPELPGASQVIQTLSAQVKS